MSLAEVLKQPFVAELLPPLLDRHHKSLDLIGERTELLDGTLYFDITDQPVEGYNKFVPYFLHPDATYSVGLSKSSFRTKVAVGSNPWTKARPEEMVNLAQICERYGGGGHARVGAISFPQTRAIEPASRPLKFSVSCAPTIRSRDGPRARLYKLRFVSGHDFRRALKDGEYVGL